MPLHRPAFLHHFLLRWSLGPDGRRREDPSGSGKSLREIPLFLQFCLADAFLKPSQRFPSQSSALWDVGGADQLLVYVSVLPSWAVRTFSPHKFAKSLSCLWMYNEKRCLDFKKQKTKMKDG